LGEKEESNGDSREIGVFGVRTVEHQAEPPRPEKTLETKRVNNHNPSRFEQSKILSKKGALPLARTAGGHYLFASSQRPISVDRAHQPCWWSFPFWAISQQSEE
jgi:hypothetical protein